METNTQSLEDLKLQLAYALNEVRRLRALQKRNPIQGIGGVIQRWRESRGLNLSKFAGLCGMSISSLSRMEKSEIPNIELKTILKISSALNISPSQLVQEFEDSMIRDIKHA